MLGRVLLFVLVMNPALAFPQKALWLWNTEEPPSYFMVEVARVGSAIGGMPGFRGHAVHDFRGVSSLLLEQ